MAFLRHDADSLSPVFGPLIQILFSVPSCSEELFEVESFGEQDISFDVGKLCHDVADVFAKRFFVFRLPRVVE